MDARSVDEIPQGEQWQYEPKWDGFRCLVFRDGERVEMQSKSGQSLGRYFPELIDAVGKLKAKQFVLDAEIVVPEGKSISFDALLQRIHPAASRIRKLAAQTPGALIVFDLLVDERGAHWRSSPWRSDGRRSMPSLRNISRGIRELSSPRRRPIIQWRRRGLQGLAVPSMESSPNASTCPISQASAPAW